MSYLSFYVKCFKDMAREHITSKRPVWHRITSHIRKHPNRKCAWGSVPDDYKLRIVQLSRYYLMILDEILRKKDLFIRLRPYPSSPYDLHNVLMYACSNDIDDGDELRWYSNHCFVTDGVHEIRSFFSAYLISAANSSSFCFFWLCLLPMIH